MYLKLREIEIRWRLVIKRGYTYYGDFGKKKKKKKLSSKDVFLKCLYYIRCQTYNCKRKNITKPLKKLDRDPR